MDKSYPLNQLEVRLANRDEISQWNDYMRRYHYLSLKWLGGKSLRYIAHINGEWVALLGWTSASKNCGAREQYIGWHSTKKYRRLCFIANNSRFLILPWVQQKNLASKILSMNLKRLSCDFEALYGHPIYMAETFVDESRFKGTCYIASNWKHIGYTQGYGRINRSYHHHGQVKAIYIYELCKSSRELLSGDLIPYDSLILKKRRSIEMMIKFPIEQLLEVISHVTDHRRQAGKRHSLESILTISVCAVLCGCRTYLSVGKWAESLSIEELKRFGNNRGTPPSEPTIRRVLQRIDANQFDRLIGGWLLEKKIIEFGGNLKGLSVAIDGKTLRGSHNGGQKPIHLLGAVIHKDGVIIAQEAVGEKTNEIKHMKSLLHPLNIEGVTVTADALHTQTELARYLVKKKSPFHFHS